VTLREIHAVAWSLAETSGRHAGAYDGWDAEPAPSATDRG
jgi:hypothetical protein